METRPIHAKENSSSSKNSPTIGVGIIGVSVDRGWAGPVHIPALRALPEFDILALCTTKAATAKAAAAAFDVPSAFDNYHELIALPSVDLVVVTVKVPHHLELVTAALHAGKMVYCEWPLGNGLDEAVTLNAHARRAGVRTVVGLQGRVAPAIGYVRDLIRDGYVGEVLSTSLIGSGNAWGAVVARSNAYLADVANGATLLSIPTGHALDTVCSVLGDLAAISARLVQRRNTTTVAEDGAILPMTSPDQVLIHGVLQSGATASVHYRGGNSRGTNLLWEVNGTKGDIRITGASGHMQMADLVLEGATDGEQRLQRLPVPARYRRVPDELDAAAVNVAQVYASFAAELNGGARVTADFEHAERTHRLVAAIEESSISGSQVSV
jgi:predicted dehydrogenase